MNSIIPYIKTALFFLLIIAMQACNSNASINKETADPEMKILYGVNKDNSIKYLNPQLSVEDRVSDLLSRMSLEEKAGQLVQSERKSVTPADVQKYGLGSVLSGGGSIPGDNRVSDWNSMIKEYQLAAYNRELKIPIIYGIDAVHGHSNVQGATIFPHNIGLGAANNDSLMFLMGKITSQEVFKTGINWNFAPCVAVAEDPRWGRTYESFSTDHDIVTKLGKAYTKGAQSIGMVACAKHFIGDGGTQFGTGIDGMMDRGNTVIDNNKFNLLLDPYREQVNVGVQTVMPSYSSLNGIKMHQNDTLINDVLKKNLKFKGFVISDWLAIEEIPNATFEEQVWLSVNAGVDMLMQPERWKESIQAIVKGVAEGKISEERLNEAVSRILTVKFESGLFEDPILKNNTDKATHLRSAEAVAVATKLAEESLVLLKNEDNILPIKKDTKVLVIGEGADNMGLQCGGWTIDWQGKIDSLSKTTSGVTILEGLNNLSESKNIKVLTDQAQIAQADMILMVLSEIPYAEMKGDSKDLSIVGTHAYKENQALIDFAGNSGKPVVTIILAGRHLVDVGTFLPRWESAIMAYLPGSEGGQAIANVLVGKSNFKGKTPMPWYKSVKDIQEESADLLFDVGYGLKYK